MELKMIQQKELHFTAEIGINHNGDLKTAIKMIDSAIDCGFNSVKFQTYKTELRVKKNSPIFDILKKCELSNKDFIKIKKYCDDKKIIFYSTPFDIDSAYFLNDLNVEYFKIASFDISNLKLVKLISKFKKKTIISTGMATKKEIDIVYNLFNKKKIIILHCVSAYPCPETESNLNKIRSLQNNYKCSIGISDHNTGINTSLYARALGAVFFEKHFMLKGQKCPDAAVSITPDLFTKLKKEINKLDLILGNGNYGISKIEKEITQFKRYSR